MLTTDQCIEIAEKVWGAKVTEMNAGGAKYPMWYLTPNDLVSHSFLVQEVNSWQGFGRTVEAMDAKDWTLEECCSEERYELGDVLSFAKDEKVIQILRDEIYRPRDLIEATHLAALEAINE